MGCTPQRSQTATSAQQTRCVGLEACWGVQQLGGGINAAPKPVRMCLSTLKALKSQGAAAAGCPILCVAAC
jgi:hypothetical protein